MVDLRLLATEKRTQFDIFGIRILAASWALGYAFILVRSRRVSNTFKSRNVLLREGA